MDDAWPAGSGTSLKAPLWFFVDQIPPGDAVTLEYSAVAPTTGPLQLKTNIALSDGNRAPTTGSLRTMMSILRVR